MLSPLISQPQGVAFNKRFFFWVSIIPGIWSIRFVHHLFVLFPVVENSLCGPADVFLLSAILPPLPLRLCFCLRRPLVVIIQFRRLFIQIGRGILHMLSVDLFLVIFFSVQYNGQRETCSMPDSCIQPSGYLLWMALCVAARSIGKKTHSRPCELHQARPDPHYHIIVKWSDRGRKGGTESAYNRIPNTKPVLLYVSTGITDFTGAIWTPF